MKKLRDEKPKYGDDIMITIRNQLYEMWVDEDDWVRIPGIRWEIPLSAIDEDSEWNKINHKGE